MKVIEDHMNYKSIENLPFVLQLNYCNYHSKNWVMEESLMAA